MVTNHMRPGLFHEFAGLNDDRFFKLIDETGGWPVGLQYVGFEHTTERAAGFTNHPGNDGWWTVVASADDYYLWKLSPPALQRIVDAAVNAIRLPAVSASKLFIKNSRNRQAVIAKDPANVS